MCTFTNCNNKDAAKGLCSKHYMRLYRASGGTCQECDRTIYCRGLCESHYKTLLRLENPEYDTAQRDIDTSNKSLRNPEYKKAHDNVRRIRGRASNYSCVDCGGTAREWSLSNETDLYGIEDKKTYPYSLNIEDYEPRCSKCHGIYDKSTDS